MRKRAPKQDYPAQHRWLIEHIGHQGDECLLWPFKCDPVWGRARIMLDGRLQWAHRVMCAFVKGPPPVDKPQALHSCGNGHLGCVNPNHLSWGTNSENAIDRRRHGRREGSIGPRTRLTLSQIAEIKAGRESQLALAAKFNVSRSCIQWWQGDRWPKLEPKTPQLRLGQ